jgi:methionine-rich copper-binding protein CopC
MSESSVTGYDHRWGGRALRTLLRSALVMLALAVALVAAVATAETAAAHATLVKSSPAAEAVLEEAPTRVTLTFAEDLDPAGSDIIVYDARLKQVSVGQAAVDRADLKTTRVSMQGNDSEVYVVVWHNASADDGDPDAGSFVFTIGTPSSNSTAGGGSSEASSAAGPPVVLVALLAAILGLIGGGAGTAFVLRRGGGWTKVTPMLAMPEEIR